MKLYTVQTIDVLAQLYRDKIYFTDWSKCFYLQEKNGGIQYENCYRWMLNKYNEKKKHDFSAPLIWWTTAFEDSDEYFKRCTIPGAVFIKAEVPDKIVLLHLRDEWEMGPFSNFYLGWKGHRIFTSDLPWTEKEEELFDKLWNIYNKNQLAKEETWNEIFNITKNSQQIEAVTPFIDLTWLINNKERGINE